MKIRVDKFCSLATSPTWQIWLYNHDPDIYRQFMVRMQNSKSCSQNTTIMQDIFKSIMNSDGKAKLIDFISMHYPYMIELGEKRKSNPPTEFRFEYVPGIITYPRRMVFEGSLRELKVKINSFVLDKYKYDSIILGNKGYVEYLTREDKEIEDQIPLNNWKIPEYRLRLANET